ncbi:hypothetical protein GCM10010302_05060 [Streptomyces polychromogenes]|uniref:Squalene cyclase C-terminal domain-containing protein n=1 Tax=Streptomyces polychromogenes TaxID=67342 RepID=A0ABP3EP65_9ACTN
MTLGTTTPPTASHVTELLSAVDRDPWGSTSPSVYETARVQSWAPWLPGRHTRWTWLLDQQHSDGLWGEGSLGHRVLPTLSTVAALLHHLAEDGDEARTLQGRHRTQAAARGLYALTALPPNTELPDTAAVELLVPGLLGEINELLDTLHPGDHPDLAPLLRGPRLTTLCGLPATTTAELTRWLTRRPTLPAKLHHCFEGIAAACPPALIPTAPTTLLGGSPAAAAAWLATAPPTPAHRTQRTLLEALAARYQGLLPEAAPITAFERLWVLTALERGNLLTGHESLARSWVTAILDPNGVAGVPGLEPDADDTALALHLAARLGLPHDHTVLDRFRTPTHYACYIGEDTGSTTANAHVLLALGSCLHHRPTEAARLVPLIDTLTGWLLDHQQPDGSWNDKWHASPYYATARVTAALHHTATPRPGAAAALRSAARWAIDTQRPDGSWGLHQPTTEETAYALQILPRSPGTTTPATLTRVHSHLTRQPHPSHPQHPALWHDKTLYAPTAIIHAELLAAHHALADRPRAVEQATADQTTTTPPQAPYAATSSPTRRC